MHTLKISFGVVTALALSAGSLVKAQSQELGFHGGTRRLDNGYYGTWAPGAEYDYAVCGGDHPFLSGISVNEEGLWNNSALCSSYPISAFDVPSYVAQPVRNVDTFSSKVLHVADCGEDGFVIGVAQPSGDRTAGQGTPVLCGQLPAPSYDCSVVEMPGNVGDLARDAWEPGAADWTSYPSATCGAGRFARAVAYRKYEIDHLFVKTHSWAMGGLICCAL